MAYQRSPSGIVPGDMGCKSTEYSLVSSPAGLVAAEFQVEGDEFAIMGWDLARGESLPSNLTPSEVKIAELLLAGHSNAEIAQRRRTSVRTVANQVASLYRKYGIGSRSELFAALARRRR